MSSGHVLRAYYRGLRREAHALLTYPGLVFQQLHNRLQWEEEASITARVADARERYAWDGRAWLRTRFPPRESAALVRTLDAHDGSVKGCAFSPDGRHVASVGDDASVKLWDIGSGLHVATMRGHQGIVWACAFSPDGSLVASAGHDHTLRLWETATGTEVARFSGHAGPVVDCAFAPNGDRLVSASWDTTFKVWNLVGGQSPVTLAPWQRPGEPIDPDDYRHRGDGCVFTPEGSGVVTVGAHDVQLWNVQGAGPVRGWGGHTFCAISPDGTRVAAAGGIPGTGLLQWQVVLHDVRAPGEPTRLLGHTDAVRSGAFSPDGRRIATASRDRTVRVWDVGTGEVMAVLTGHSAPAVCCAFHPDGALVVSGGEDGTLRLWDLAAASREGAHMGHQDAVRACAYSPDGTWIATGSDDDTYIGDEGHQDLRIWDARSGVLRLELPGHRGGVRACAVSPDGARIASVSEVASERTLALWDARTGTELLRLQHSKVLAGCAFSPSGTQVLCAAWDGTLRVWDAADGTELAPFVGSTGTGGWPEMVACCAIAPDGTTVASGGSDGLLRLWDPRSRAELAALEGHDQGIECCAFSPDGRRVVSGGWDTTLRLWDTDARVPLTVLTGHTAVVRACAFGADGTWIASGADDGTLRIWDASTGAATALFPLLGAVAAVAAHPRVAQVACGGEDGAVYLLDLVGTTVVHRPVW